MPKNLSGECQVKIQNMCWLKTCRVKCKKICQSSCQIKCPKMCLVTSMSPRMYLNMFDKTSNKLSLGQDHATYRESAWLPEIFFTARTHHDDPSSFICGVIIPDLKSVPTAGPSHGLHLVSFFRTWAGPHSSDIWRWSSFARTARNMSFLKPSCLICKRPTFGLRRRNTLRMMAPSLNPCNLEDRWDENWGAWDDNVFALVGRWVSNSGKHMALQKKRLISRRFFHWQPRCQFMRSILCQHGSAHTSTKVWRIMNQRRANNGPSSLVIIVCHPFLRTLGNFANCEDLIEYLIYSFWGPWLEDVRSLWL